jgi:hypothetical protein
MALLLPIAFATLTGNPAARFALISGILSPPINTLQVANLGPLDGLVLPKIFQNGHAQISPISPVALQPLLH